MSLATTKPILMIAAMISLVSCTKEDPTPAGPTVTPPSTYSFLREGNSTVSYTGQSERLAMGGELSNALLDFTKTETELKEMFANQDVNGNPVDPFSDPALNASAKSLKSKTASSKAYFSSNTAESAAIKADFDSWITLQVQDIFPNENEVAAAGKAGQIADGTSARYVNAQGLEYNQAFVKSLMGACMMDQMLNNYLDESVLDEGTNREDNSNGVTATDKDYTNMEHKWDEAYGYLFGGAPDGTNPLNTLGNDDVFLNKYLKRVNDDSDFNDIAQDIYNAFIMGRAAIVAKEYNVRDQQADIIREKVSLMIGVRAVYYLQAGKNAKANGEMGTAFHDLSEGYGFLYSLRFTHNPATGQPYFTKTEVEGMINDIMGGTNGLWDVQAGSLDLISDAIANRFGFTVAQAAN